jgi:hypothetical protein
MPEKIFLSYAHRDSAYKNMVLARLGVPELKGRLSVWSDDSIVAGATWRVALAQEIDEAKIVILLVTTNFLNSPLALDPELRRLLGRRRREGGRVVPLICRPCAWRAVPWLERLPAWPPDGEPLWPREDANPSARLSQFVRKIINLTEEPTLTGTASAALQLSALVQMKQALLPHERLGVVGLADLLRTAIAIGTPLYNRGERAACTELYSFVASELWQRLDAVAHEGLPRARAHAPSGEFGGSDEGAPPPAAVPRTSAEALSVLTPAASTMLLEVARLELWATRGPATERSLDDTGARAWALRHCFDRLLLIIKMAEECATLPSLARLPDLSGFKQFARRTLALMDDVAEQTGVESDEDFSAGALSCAAVGLLGVLALHQVLLRHRGRRPSADNARLRGSLSLVFGEELAKLDACLVAWQCRCYLQRLAASFTA